MEEIQFIEKGNSENCLLLIHGFCSDPARPKWINERILSWLIKLKLHFRN